MVPDIEYSAQILLGLAPLLSLKSDENLPVIVICVSFDFASDSKLILCVNVVNCIGVEVHLDLDLLDNEVVLQKDLILFILFGLIFILPFFVILSMNSPLFDNVISEDDSFIVEPCH